MRELITEYLDENFEQVTTDLMELEPKERIKFYLDLLQYCVPKLQRTQIEFETATREPFSIKIFTVMIPTL
jgi:hypothetical protein